MKENKLIDLSMDFYLAWNQYRTNTFRYIYAVSQRKIVKGLKPSVNKLLGHLFQFETEDLNQSNYIKDYIFGCSVPIF